MHSDLHSSSPALREAWALAGLMRGRYGNEALPAARKEVETETDSETLRIWHKVVECLSRRT